MCNFNQLDLHCYNSAVYSCEVNFKNSTSEKNLLNCSIIFQTFEYSIVMSEDFFKSDPAD